MAEPTANNLLKQERLQLADASFRDISGERKRERERGSQLRQNLPTLLNHSGEFLSPCSQHFSMLVFCPTGLSL